MTRGQKRAVAAFVVALVGFLALMAAVANDANGVNGNHTLTVDGTVYQPTKIVGSGPTVHYFTPGTTPSVAYTERHIWSHHGSGNLPCAGLLHWIDNANVLTISHCEFEDGTTTTTSTPTDTTTTSLPVVTTTTPPSTTTTVVSSTTSTTQEGSTTTSTLVESTTTSLTLCGKGGDAPCGGVNTGGGAMADALAQLNGEAPGPIVTCNGSGVRTLVGVMVFGLGMFALALLAALVGAAIWRGRND